MQMGLVAFVLLAVLVGCAGADATAMVRMQAAQDFVCGESTIEVRREVDGTFRAVGCGKQGTYRAICEGMRCAVFKQGGALLAPASRGVAPQPHESRRFR